MNNPVYKEKPLFLGMKFLLLRRVEWGGARTGRFKLR